MTKLNRRILVVDDNELIQDDFRKILSPQRISNMLKAGEAALFANGTKRDAGRNSGVEFEMSVASQGVEALELVRQSLANNQPYAMAFMDVRMPPGWDGIETALKLWEVDRRIQIVFCTAFSDSTWDEMCSRLGHTDSFIILKKPFDVVEVLQVANAFTQKWNLCHGMQERGRRLQESENRYELLMDAIPSLVWSADSEGHWDFVNQRWLFHCGCSMDQIRDKGWTHVMHPEDAARASEIWNKCVASGTVYNVEYRLKSALDGTYRWHLGRALPMRDGEGRIVQWIGTANDIHDQKRAEKVLLDSQAELERRVVERTEELVATRTRLEYLLRSSPNVIYSIKLGPRRLTYISDNLPSVLGYSVEEFMGNPTFWVDHVHSDDLGTGRDPHCRFLQAERHPSEYRFRHKDGTYRWIHDDARLVRNEQGQPIEIIGSMADITAMKEAEQVRQTMELQLRQSQKLEAIGQLAAGIAHEINTPTQYVGDNVRFLKDSFASIFTVLQSYEQLLQAAKSNSITPELIAEVERTAFQGDLEYLSEQIPAAVKETLEGIGRVAKIVRAMKEFSHPGGKEKSSADLNKAIETTATVARNEWKYVAEMVLELDPALPLVPCFVGEFNQVMLNLIVNAAHTIGDAVKEKPGTRGTITICSRRDGDWVEVSIRDTGKGIPEAVRNRIFEPFFTTKEVGKGSGQGLSIVYGSIVKKHGGTVRFETEVGQGTTFILRLPLTPRTSELVPAVAEPSASENTTEPLRQPVTLPAP